MEIQFDTSPGGLRFSRGSLSITRWPQAVRTLTFTGPNDLHYRPRIMVGGSHGIVPFDFRSGSLSDLYFAGPREMVLLSGVSVVFPNGTILITEDPVPSVGAISEFAFWPDAASDPGDLLVESATANSSGNVGDPFTRHSAVVHLPEEARYFGFGGRFKNVPYQSGGYRHHHLRKAQAEMLPVGDSSPTPWSDAREVRTILHADRVNHSPNPNFYTDTSNWTLLTRVSDGSGGFRGEIAVPGSGAAEPVHTVPGLSVGMQYTFSFRVESDTAAVVVVGGQRFSVGPTARRVGVAFTATATTASLVVRIEAGASPATVSISRAMVEDGVGPDQATANYFDGYSGPDFVWETGGVEGSSRSYYYKNRVDRYRAAVRILKDSVPLGIGAADPQFGVPPS